MIQKHRRNRFLLREVSRTFDSAFPARSKFTTFWHQKVAPKVSAGHLRRDRTAVLPERARKIYAVCARSLRALAQVSSLFPLFSQCIPAGRNSLKYNFKRFALRPKPEERQTAAAPCGGLHRPATGGRRILRRLRADKGGRLSSVTRRYRAGRSLAHRAYSKGSTPQSSSRNASDKQPSASTSFDLHIGTLRN